MTETEKPSWRKYLESDHAIGAAIGVVYVIWLLATARELGFPRDEGFYFHASSDYARWFDMLFNHPSQAF